MCSSGQVVFDKTESCSEAQAVLCCCRVTLSATLLPGIAAPPSTHIIPDAELVQEPSAAVPADVSGTAEPPPTLEHKLQLAYKFADGETVDSGPILAAAATASAENAATDTSLSLSWSSTQQLPVSRATVQAIASSNAALPILLTTASRSVSKPPAVDAAMAPAGKPAKAGKAATAPEEMPWQSEQQCALPVDLAALLVGDREVTAVWPQKGLVMPPQLQSYSRIQLHVEVLLCNACYAGAQ